MKKYEVRKHYEDGSYDVMAVCDTYEEADYQYQLVDRQNQEFTYTWLDIEEVEK